MLEGVELGAGPVGFAKLPDRFICDNRLEMRHIRALSGVGSYWGATGNPDRWVTLDGVVVASTLRPNQAAEALADLVEFGYLERATDRQTGRRCWRMMAPAELGIVDAGAAS